MRKLLWGTAALALLQTAPAMAATGDQSTDFQISAAVGAACSAITTQPIAFGTLSIDSSTGRLTPSQTKSSDPTAVWCNGINSTLTFVGNNGSSITNTKTSSDTAFTSTLTYTPSVMLKGQPVASGATIGAIAGNLVVTAGSLSDGGKLPVAGDYNGSITVTLSPAV